MKLLLLGTGGYFPTSQRQTACLMLPEIGVLLDAGTGLCHLAQHLQTDRLDIFLTHAHLDHIAGLTYLVNLVPPDVLRNTTVHGEAAKLTAVQEHLFAEAIFPVPPQFKFEPLPEVYPLPSGGTLTHFPLQHPCGSIGFRLDWPDRSLAYVTDTTATPGAPYIDHIRGVDLLIHESNFPTDAGNMPTVTGHSSLMAVAALAAEAGVGQLVITHIDPLLESDRAFDLPTAQRTFQNITLAHDGLELNF